MKAKHDQQTLRRLFEAMPPESIEAEMAVLGSILVEPECLGDVLALLPSGSDFSRPAHGAVFDAMREVYDRDGALDVVLLHELLRDRKTIDAVGGLDYIVQLASAMPSAANAVHYARKVADKSRVRRFIELAGDALYDAHHNADDIDDVINAHQTAVFALSIADDPTAKTPTLAQAMNDELEAISRQMDGDGVVGVPSGFVELDQLTGGFMPGEMIVIAARPSVGKSALMLNLATNMATTGKSVGMVSLEMTRQQLVHRMLASRATVDASRIRNGQLSKQEFQSLCVASADLREAKLLIDDTPGLNTTQLRARATRMKQRDAIDVLFIDYLQLLRGPSVKRENRQVEVSDISQCVKCIARELKIPVVILAQVNRSPAAEMRKPRSSDLRESGSIEQDADVVMLLHREDFMRKDDPDWLRENPDMHNVAELIVDKQRNGPTDTIRLTWNGIVTRFNNYTPARVGETATKPQQQQLQLAGAGADDEDDEVEGLPV